MVGSQTEDPQRMMDFVDWLYSPEGVQAGGSDTSTVSGPEGLTWEVKDGQPQFTELGKKVFIEKDSNAAVPEEWGGGSYMDGVSAINYGAIGNKDVDSETGIPYNYAMWDAYKEMTETALSKDWSEHFNTQESPIDYFQQLGKICVIPGTAWQRRNIQRKSAQSRNSASRLLSIIRGEWYLRKMRMNSILSLVKCRRSQTDLDTRMF